MKLLYVALIGCALLTLGRGEEPVPALLPMVYFASPSKDASANWSFSMNSHGACSVSIYRPEARTYEIQIKEDTLKELASSLGKIKVPEDNQVLGKTDWGGQRLQFSFGDIGGVATLIVNLGSLDLKNMQPDQKVAGVQLREFMVGLRALLAREGKGDLDRVTGEIDEMLKFLPGKD